LAGQPAGLAERDPKRIQALGALPLDLLGGEGGIARYIGQQRHRGLQVRGEHIRKTYEAS
jgi:hypothetical protein